MTKSLGLLAALTVMVAVFAQTASLQAANWFVTTNGSGDGSSWSSPTNSIQGAIVASTAGDTVWVSNGVYEAGGITNYPAGTSLTNRVAIYKAITVRSANNDPTNTIIKGAWDPTSTNGPAAVRCVWMTNGSALIGFTLTNGATFASGANNERGGGVSSQSTNTTISNCVLIGNSAYYGGGAFGGTLYNCTLITNSATYGGGADGTLGTLNNCTLSGNSAVTGGGGSYYGALYNCTLTSNSAVTGGGAYYSTLTNCTLSGNSASGNGGGSYYGTLNNCMLSGNSASGNGGGATASTLTNCTLTGNSALRGGGAWLVYMYNCTMISNSGSIVGGGAYQSYTLNNCTLSGNSAGSGGGASASTLNNCTLSGNSAGNNGGGADSSTLYNCTLTGNSAGGGGAAIASTLNNCTLTGNSASGNGGGAYFGTLINSIVYFNSATTSASNWYNVVAFTNTCTTPAATNGPGNITDNPLLVDKGSGFGTNHVAGNYRLQPRSPCINRGTNMSWMTGAVDLDAQVRIRYGIVDMGAYEIIYSGTIFTIK